MNLPIAFSPEMIMANAEGRKSQTRRILVPRPDPEMKLLSPPYLGDDRRLYVQFAGADGLPLKAMRLPYAPGDTLWVRETYYQYGHWEPVHGQRSKTGRQKWAFVADSPEVLFEKPEACRLGRHHQDPWASTWHKRLARFMPRAFSRQTITVTSVRVMRLHDLCEDDAMAEGVARLEEPEHSKFVVPTSGDPRDWPCGETARDAFAALWKRLHGTEAWLQNPWVVAIGYRQEILRLPAASSKSLPMLIIAEPYSMQRWRA